MKEQVFRGLLMLSLLVTLAVSMSVQSARGQSNAASYCGGEWGVYTGDNICSFRCFAGDNLYVFGHAADEFGQPYAVFTASCGGVTVQCADAGGSPGCQVFSNDLVQRDDDQGICSADGSAWGWYSCADIVLTTPR
jgi:hypothetical protein